MNLLINEPPLQVLPTLAAKIGLNNAIVLQQVHYWLRVSNNIREGHKWVYRTMDEWKVEFPFWSKATLERVIKELEKSKILVSDNHNKLKMDRTKWYRIDYETLEKVCNDAFQQNEGMETVKMREWKPSNCGDGTHQNEVNDSINLTVPITREYTETTTEITTEKKNSRKQVYDESSVEYQLAYMLYEKILLDDSSFKKPNLQSWADHIRLMMERDNRTKEQIEYLIEWSQHNPFWKSNILSTKKLREKATTLIRQIKAEQEPKPYNNPNKRTEHVPDWFHKRNEKCDEISKNEAKKEEFEARRKEMLQSIGIEDDAND